MKYKMIDWSGRWLISAGVVFLALSPAKVSAQNGDSVLVSVEELGEVSAQFIQLGLIATGAVVDGLTIHGVDIYKITYRTTGVSGESTLASGALYVPQTGLDSVPVILYQHGTIMNRDQVPSARAEDPPGLFFAGYGYAVAMADYLGLGENPGLHPYLHWETEATASLDMLRAAREFMNDSLALRENRLFLAGYSQGGHATMAVHKYIHVNQLDNEFSVTGSVPMSGPYALSTAQFDHIFSQDSTYTGSYYIPYIAASYQLVYGNLYGDHSEYYDPPYDSIFAAWEATGTYFDQLSMDEFPRNFYEFMQDSVMDNLLSDPGHPFRQDLRSNDLDDWAPQEPVRMLYCGMDMHVAPSNSTSALESMQSLGAADVQAINVNDQFNHATCAIPAFLHALGWFESFSTGTAGVPDANPADEGFLLYPNPVHHVLTIEVGVPGVYDLGIYDFNGRQLIQQRIRGTIHQVDLSGFSEGIYVVTLRDGERVYRQKIVKL